MGMAQPLAVTQDLSAIDFVWKTDFSSGRKLILQGEYFLRDEDGQVTFTEDGDIALFNYNGEQTGWYAQGVFQFAPQWRTGIRYDRLDANNKLAMISNATAESDEEVFEESGFESSDHDPDRWTVMLDWTPSEFSRVRMQYAHDNSREESDDQIMIQYIMSFWRTWLSSVLNGGLLDETVHTFINTGGYPHSILQCYCTDKGLCLRAGMGGTYQDPWWQACEGLQCYSCQTRSTQGSGTTIADSSPAHCRPGRMHWCRIGNGLDAHAATPCPKPKSYGWKTGLF